MKHGLRRLPEYQVWRGLKKRCLLVTDPAYRKYGGRGIKVDPRWAASFEAFIADVGRRPSPDHSLDRIDNDGDYAPDNVRWATAREQNINRSTTRWITIDGETLCMADWCARNGLTRGAAMERIRRGWDPVDAVSIPAKQKLSEQAVREINAAIAAGEKYRTIARRHGVTAECIGHIARGISWGHLRSEVQHG